MRATVTGVNKEKSRYGGHEVYAVFLKGEDGKSYRTWVDPKNRNYQRWSGKLTAGTVLDGVNVKSGSLVDADSMVTVVAE